MRRATSPLGRGWPFPIAPSEDGRLEAVEGGDKVAQAIRLILETEPGERVMRPDFGAGLRRHMMKPNTAATRALIREEVERALRRWERRIDLQLIEVSPVRGEPSRVDIQVHYLHRRDRRPDTLVYPFYLE